MFSDAGYMCFISERIGTRHGSATYEILKLLFDLSYKKIYICIIILSSYINK